MISDSSHKAKYLVLVNHITKTIHHHHRHHHHHQSNKYEVLSNIQNRSNSLCLRLDLH